MSDFPHSYRQNLGTTLKMDLCQTVSYVLLNAVRPVRSLLHTVYCACGSFRTKRHEKHSIPNTQLVVHVFACKSLIAAEQIFTKVDIMGL